MLVCALAAVASVAWILPDRLHPTTQDRDAPAATSRPAAAVAPRGGGPTAADEGEIGAASGGSALRAPNRRSRADLPVESNGRPNADVPLRITERGQGARTSRQTVTLVVPPRAPVPQPSPRSSSPSTSSPHSAAPPAAAATPSAGTTRAGTPFTGAPGSSGTAGGTGSGASPGLSGADASGASSNAVAPAPPAAAPVVLPPRVISTPGTSYPGDAFRLTVRRQDLGAAAAVEGSEGVVAIRALVLATGDVRSVEVTASSGSDALDRAAVDAVRGWRFAPATRDGAPIAAYVVLRIRYVVR